MFINADRIDPDFSMRAIHPRDDASLIALPQQDNHARPESAHQRLDHWPLTT